MVEYLARGADVGYRNRLTTACVVRHRQHSQRDVLRPHLLDEDFQFFDVYVAFEGRVAGGVESLFGQQVDRIAAPGDDVGLGGVEVHVTGHRLARFDRAGEEHALGGAALVGGHEVLKAGD